MGEMKDWHGCVRTVHTFCLSCEILLLLFVAHLVAAGFEDFVCLRTSVLVLVLRRKLTGSGRTEIVLEPSDVRVQASEFPHSVDFLVPVEVERVCVALDGDLSEGLVCVFLVWYAELVVAFVQN